MAEGNCEDRLEEAAIFSVMITGSRFFLVDSDADAKTSLFSRVSRGGSVEGEGEVARWIYVSIEHTKHYSHKLLSKQIGIKILLATVFPHIIHLFSFLILFRSNYLVITCMSAYVFPHLIFHLFHLFHSIRHSFYLRAVFCIL